MEFNALNEARLSVRDFNGQAVSEDLLRQMVAAAQQAPSWKNSQTTRYYCICTPEKVAEFREKVLPGFNQNSTAKAGAYVVSTYVKNRAGFDREGNADNEIGNGWGAYDLGLHDMTLTLKAKDLGLETLIMGLRDADAIRQMCGVSDAEEVMSVIAVGYADAVPNKPVRKPLEDVAKFF